ncbi:MAG: hypothetical protein ACRD22_09375 [Terriglobia bacterium]
MPERPVYGFPLEPEAENDVAGRMVAAPQGLGDADRAGLVVALDMGAGEYTQSHAAENPRPFVGLVVAGGWIRITSGEILLSWEHWRGRTDSI